MSPVYDCTTDEGRDEGVARAADAARAGEVVVLPTDTVYGIGTDAFSADGVASLLAAKGRGRDMPPPVLIPNVRAVDGLASEVPEYARDLIKEFWPGPLTLVFQAQSSLMWDLGDTNGTVALRMPDDDIALRVLAEVGPMAVTSANRTGQPAATTVIDAATQLGASVQVYLDGGTRNGSQASTIIDCTGESPSILRTGAIGEEQLAPILERQFPKPESAQDGDEPGNEADTGAGQAHDREPDSGEPEGGEPEGRERDGGEAVEATP